MLDDWNASIIETYNEADLSEIVPEKMGIDKKIPCLRRVGVSPWSNKRDMADKLKKDYINCLKLSPVPLSFANMDSGEVRKTVRETLAITRDNNAEFIMQDTHTFGGRVQNAIDWCTIVRQETENF